MARWESARARCIAAVTNTWALPLVVGAAVRLPHLGDSFYGDEGFSVTRDSLSLYTQTDDRFRPVFFSILYLWRQLGFSGESGLRLLCVIFGLLQIPLAYLVGRKLARETALGPVFAWFVSLSPFLIEFSQELRMYSLVAMLALAMALTALDVIERPSRIASWTRLLLVSVAGLYTHLHFFFALAGLLAFLLWERSVSRLRTVSLFALIGVLYVPNLPNVVTFASVRSGQYPIHVPSALPKIVAAFTVGFNYFTLGEQHDATRKVSLGDVARNGGLTLGWVFLVLLLVYGFYRTTKRPAEGGGNAPMTYARGHRMVLTLGLLPVLLAMMASVATNQSFAHPKYLIFAAPFASLFMAMGFVALNNQRLQTLSAVVASLVVGLALFHFWNPAQYGRREDWRGAAETLRVGAGAADDGTAVIELATPYSLLRYYNPQLAQREVIVAPPGPDEGDGELTSRLARTIVGTTQVHYVWSDVMKNEHDPGDRTLLALTSLCGEGKRTTFNPRFRLYSFSCGAHRAGG